MNYSIINKINKFITKKKKKKNMNDKITNAIFNKEIDSDYLCLYLSSKKFKIKYSELIKVFNDGNYEYYFKMNVIKLFYQKNEKNFFKILLE